MHTNQRNPIFVRLVRDQIAFKVTARQGFAPGINGRGKQCGELSLAKRQSPGARLLFSTFRIAPSFEGVPTLVVQLCLGESEERAQTLDVVTLCFSTEQGSIVTPRSVDLLAAAIAQDIFLCI